MRSLGGVDLHDVGDLRDEAVWRAALTRRRRAREAALATVATRTALSVPVVVRVLTTKQPS